MSDWQNIPEELRDRDQWLLWDASADTPRQPHWRGDFYGISWSDPDDWHSFPEAVAAAQEVESWGIGYVMALDNDDHGRGVYGCLDLDGVVLGRERTKDWLPSLDWAVRDDAYIERSPSGDGLHIPLFNPEVPDWWRDSHFSPDEHEGVELLTNKFVTFTGEIIGDHHDGVTAADPTEFLYHAYEALNDEAPRDAGSGGSDAAEHDEIDRDLVEDMLGHIPSNVAYESWRNILFAIRDWDGGATGQSVAEQWSRGSGWDEDSQRFIDSIWDRDRNPSNPITVGTLFHHAEQNGWSPPERERDAEPPSMAELVARYSDEFEEASDVPDDVFESDESGRDAAAEAAAVAGERDTTRDSEPRTDDASGDSDAPGWDDIYQAYRAAEDAEERLTPRHEAAKKLLADDDWRTIEDNDVLWRYDDDAGIYRDNGVSEVRADLSQALDEQYRKHEQTEILAQVRGRTTVPADQLGGPERLICCENGVVEIHEDDIVKREHSPEYEFLSRVQTQYDPDAECPHFKQFLDDVMPPERTSDRKKIQEFAGYLLMHWELPHHKALFLVGPTASGKSTFLDTVRSMLGEDSVANLTPQQMTTERFGGSELYQAWANIRNDIPDDLIENTGQFKEIVAGDPIKAEKKFKQPFMFRPKAKHAFSANALPEPSTDDNAFFRRVMLVAFREQIPREERDRHLDEKLQGEHPGILNWCLAGLQRLMRQGGFTGETAPWETEMKWEKWADSVKRFQKDCLEETGDGFVTSEKLFGVYRAFCEQEGIPQMVGQTQLVHDLDQRFNFDRDRRYVGDKRRRGLSFAELNDFGEDLLDEITD